MHNLYGKRKLLEPEIKGSFTLSNGMFCVWGEPEDEGISVDIYDDKTKQLLIGMEHGIACYSKATTIKERTEGLQMFIESLQDDLEDSMVYYYGPRESMFGNDHLGKPVPQKTGRFASEKRHAHP